MQKVLFPSLSLAQAGLLLWRPKAGVDLTQLLIFSSLGRFPGLADRHQKNINKIHLFHYSILVMLWKLTRIYE